MTRLRFIGKSDPLIRGYLGMRAFHGREGNRKEESVYRGYACRRGRVAGRPFGVHNHKAEKTRITNKESASSMSENTPHG